MHIKHVNRMDYLSWKISLVNLVCSSTGKYSDLGRLRMTRDNNNTVFFLHCRLHNNFWKIHKKYGTLKRKYLSQKSKIPFVTFCNINSRREAVVVVYFWCQVYERTVSWQPAYFVENDTAKYFTKQFYSEKQTERHVDKMQLVTFKCWVHESALILIRKKEFNTKLIYELCIYICKHVNIRRRRKNMTTLSNYEGYRKGEPYILPTHFAL